VEDVADSLERELLDGGEREIASKVIGELVMARLRNLDEVAYIRFASVYREYKALEEFIQEIRAISGKGAGKGNIQAETAKSGRIAQKRPITDAEEKP
jgi:transcriptional repressor NrdR